ncbi:RTA1-domain-containing protein [Auriculariales sp. MPI-PUGE-AT-0066]|nr:RTA1-domain-containing protein [Auriculariales sp. MPI-PUGE-AT-0066]
MSGFNSTVPHVLLPEDTPYGYWVSKTACYIFIVLFGISTTLHIGQSVVHRLWFPLWTAALCGVGELIGWSARLWSAINPAADDPFLMQISSTIISPTFLVAANFVILGRVIFLVGPEYSRLSPTWYTKVFLTADLVALVIQAIGGGLASSANDHAGSERGAQIMLAGIGIQFAALTIYSLLAIEFLVRVALDRPLRSLNLSSRGDMDNKVKSMIAGLIIGAIFLFVRTVYRTIELTDGWNGKVITNQNLFNWCDGMPIAVAMLTLNVFHPGRLIYNKDRILPKNDLRSTDSSNATLPMRSIETV